MNEELPANGQAMTHEAATTLPKEWTRERLAAIAAKLEVVPPPEASLTRAQAIAHLLPSLKRMRERGHTMASICEQLRANGLPVAPRTLSRCLAAAGAPNKSRRDSKRRPPAGRPAPERLD